MTLLNKDGVYGYPNNLAKDLELLAGFKIFKLYKRNIYLTLLNIKILLPFRIYNRKFHTKLDYFLKFPISLIRYKIEPTALSFFNLRIYKISNTKKTLKNFLQFGFIYEFTVSQDYGDPFIIFGKDHFPESKIGFEFSDNSA